MKLTNICKITLTLLILTIIFALPAYPAKADTIIHESATLGPTGQTSGWGLSWEQFIGSRFYVNQQVEVTAIGGHLTEWTAGNLFGAIIALTGPDDLPDGSPFYSPEVVASTVFDPGFPSSDFRTPLSVTLQPGYYALVFGTYELGASNGGGAMPYEGQVDLPGASYFIWAYDLYWGWGWYNTLPTQARFVVEGIPGYCGASGGGEGYISGVHVGTINNTGTGSDGYADYTHLSTTMVKGNGYLITVTNGDPYAGDQCGIWVDWNQDKDFDDPNETIAVSDTPGLGPYTATITPPADANLGDTRMRIRIRYTGTVSPCGATTYGEVEDYTINVIAPAPEYCQAQGGTSGCDNGIVRFRLKTIDNSTNDCDQYSDYTSISTELEIGTGHPFIVTDDWATYCALWVDWNQDKDFDDINEQIDVTYFSYGYPPYDDPLFTIHHIGIITPPEGAVLGETRLRIRTQGSGVMVPCGNTPYGEVEDYNVIVCESGTSGEESYGGGEGTEQEPYLIYTAEQMQAIGQNNHHWAKHFRLMADIYLSDFEPNTFNIIGDYMFGFSGVFDGNNHAIYNFTYSITDKDRVGIFGEISGDNAVIKDLILIDPNIEIENGDGIGVLAGTHKGGTILRCCVTGGSVSGRNGVGGLVGGNHATIEQCYSTASVSGNSYVGGLAGHSEEGLVTNSYSGGTVLGNSLVGGLVGRQYYNGTIFNCYATGSVTGDGSNVGGLLGNSGGTVTNSFWDIDLGGPNNGVGTPLSTVGMQTRSTFTDAGWDFVGETANGTDDIWDICEETNYPKLSCQIPVAGDFVCPDGVEMKDFAVIGMAWLSEPNDAHWNWVCDISDPNDNAINALDVKTFAENWLKGVFH